MYIHVKCKISKNNPFFLYILCIIPECFFISFVKSDTPSPCV